MLASSEVTVGDIQYDRERCDVEPLATAQRDYPGKVQRRLNGLLCFRSESIGNASDQADYVPVASPLVRGQPWSRIAGRDSEFEALQRGCGNNIEDVPDFTCAEPADTPAALNFFRSRCTGMAFRAADLYWRVAVDVVAGNDTAKLSDTCSKVFFCSNSGRIAPAISADTVTLLKTSRTRPAVMPCHAANFMRLESAKILWLDKYSAKFGDACSESCFSGNRISACADTADALPVPEARRSHGSIMTLPAVNPVRSVFTQPGRLGNCSAKFSDTCTKIRFSSGRATARAGRTDTSALSDITRSRRTVVTPYAADPVSFATAQPRRLNDSTAKNNNTRTEGRFRRCSTPAVILVHSRGLSPRSGTRSTVLVTPPGPGIRYCNAVEGG